MLEWSAPKSRKERARFYTDSLFRFSYRSRKLSLRRSQPLPSSRPYPLLRPRVLAPVGLSDAVSQLLDSLPDSLKDARLTCVFAPPKRWRNKSRPGHLTNPIDVHSLTHRVAPSPDTGLIVAVPLPKTPPALRIAARLLATTIPFAVLLPSDLAPRIADADQFDGQPDLQDTYKSAGKLMFLDGDQIWIVGNIPDLHHFHRIHHFHRLLQHTSPQLTVHNI